jgi:hypothetical protein
MAYIPRTSVDCELVHVFEGHSAEGGFPTLRTYICFAPV